jgi:hypothetical protein
MTDMDKLEEGGKGERGRDSGEARGGGIGQDCAKARGRGRTGQRLRTNQSGRREEGARLHSMAEVQFGLKKYVPETNEN